MIFRDLKYCFGFLLVCSYLGLDNKRNFGLCLVVSEFIGIVDFFFSLVVIFLVLKCVIEIDILGSWWTFVVVFEFGD